MANERIRNVSRGDAVFTLFTWIMGALILLCAAGAALFLLAMKYGDRLEAALLRRCGKRGNSGADD